MASYRDGRSRTSSAWEHFEISDAEAFIAKCNYCLELFSYRTSVTNLKKHVVTKHPEVLGNTEDDENAEEVEEMASDTLKPKYYRTGVWEYYDIKDPVAKLAECRLCEDGSVLSYKTTSANLSKHLLRKHKIEFVVKSEVITEDNDEEIPIERLESEDDHEDDEKGQVILHSSRPKSSIAWEHFDIQDDIQKIASCKLCGAICSYRTSVSNLLKHTRRKHGDVVSWERLETDDDSKSLRSRLKGRSIVWLYFKCVDTEREISECLLCQTRIGHGTGSHNLKRHLARRHPNVEIPGREDGSKRILLSSGGELYEVQTTDKDTEGQDNDGEMDTVYLEDFDTLEEPPAKRKKFEDLDDVRNVDDSSSDDEVTFFNKYKKKKQDSTDLFGKYVASLLKQLPTEVSLRLQSDFVKQILTAQSVPIEVATASAVNTVTDNTYTISAGNNEYVTSTEGSAYSITITAEKPDDKVAVLGIEETDESVLMNE